jgi:hypothetical protein
MRCRALSTGTLFDLTLSKQCALEGKEERGKKKKKQKTANWIGEQI